MRQIEGVQQGEKTRVVLGMEVLAYGEALSGLLNEIPEITVLAIAGSDAAVLEAASQFAPDVVLLDSQFDGATHLISKLVQAHPTLRVIVLGVRDVPDVILNWVEAGACAFVPQNASVEALVRVLKGSMRDELHCSRRIAGQLMRKLADRAASARPLPNGVDELTVRQREVLRLLAEGLPNKVIAARLGIAPATAKNHVHRILGRLDLTSRIAAASVLQGNGRSRS